MTKAHWILACFLITLCALHGGSGGTIPATPVLSTDIKTETEIIMETLTTVAAIEDSRSTQSPSHTSVPQASSTPNYTTGDGTIPEVSTLNYTDSNNDTTTQSTAVPTSQAIMDPTTVNQRTTPQDTTAGATTQTISTAAPTTILPTTMSPAPTLATTTPALTTSSAPTTQRVTTPPPTTHKSTTPSPTETRPSTAAATPPPMTLPPTTTTVVVIASTQASTSKLGELTTTTTTTTQPATVSESGKPATDSPAGDWSIIGITGKSFTGKILLPIAIGIAFSVIIIAVAYFYCSRRRPSLRSKPTSSRNGVHDMTSNDRVMLLADSSEDEF